MGVNRSGHTSCLSSSLALGCSHLHSCWCCPSQTDRGRQTESPDRVGRSVGRRAPDEALFTPFHTVKYVFFGIRFASSGHYPSQTYLLKFVSQLYDRYRNGKGPTFYRDALVIYGSSAVSACTRTSYLRYVARRSTRLRATGPPAAQFLFFVRWELGRKLGRSVGRRPTDRPSSRASYRQGSQLREGGRSPGA